MEKISPTYAKVFHLIAAIFLFLLCAFSALGMARYFMQKDYDSYAKVPSDVEILAMGEMHLPMLDLADGQAYFRLADAEYYMLDTFPNLGIFAQEDYKDYNLINLDTSSSDWLVYADGWYFRSNKSALKKLIDMWEGEFVSVEDVPVFGKLKGNTPSGDAYVYLFPDEKMQSLFEGSVLALADQRATLLSFLNRANVANTSYGKDRTKITGELLKSVPAYRNFAFVTVDFAQKFEEIASVLALSGRVWVGQAGDILATLEQMYPIEEMLSNSGEMVYDGQEIITSVGADAGNSFADDYAKYRSGSESFAIIFSPENSLHYLESQTFDDRMLTTFYFE